MCQLWLAPNAHALIVCLEKIGEAVFLIAGMGDNEVLMVLGHIFK